MNKFINKQIKNLKKEFSRNPNKIKFLFSANFLFLLFFIGFLFTTNHDATFFGKYSAAYLNNLVKLFLLIIPYNLLILFLMYDKIIISLGKNEVKLSFFTRFILTILTLILMLSAVELILRIKPKPGIENFHPYLQYITDKKIDGHMHINSDNFRYDELTKDKPENTYRIFFLGGSTVYDKDRPYEKSITKIVENKLRKKYPEKNTQVINAGYERYTSQHSLIVYQTKIADFDPDMIVIWQGFNDMYMSCTPDFIPVKTYKNDYSHFYQVLSNIIDNYFNWRFHFVVLDRFKKAFAENFYADIRNKFTKSNNKIEYTDNINFKSINAYKRNTQYLIKAANADNVKIIMGNQPNHYNNDPKNYGLMQYFCKKSNSEHISIKKINEGMKMFNDATQNIADKYQIPFVDLEKALPKNSKYLTDDVHYTDLGDRKVAEEIYNAITESIYLEQI
jgi:lysophospholipase L1-like esterase